MFFNHNWPSLFLLWQRSLLQLPLVNVLRLYHVVLGVALHIKGYSESSILWSHYVDKGKFNKCILKARVDTISCLTQKCFGHSKMVVFKTYFVSLKIIGTFSCKNEVFWLSHQFDNCPANHTISIPIKVHQIISLKDKGWRLWNYSQTCINRSPLRQRKIGLIRKEIS
jgi:hypothetical protein